MKIDKIFYVQVSEDKKIEIAIQEKYLVGNHKGIEPQTLINGKGLAYQPFFSKIR